MARDLLRFVPRPTDLAKALKKIVLGGLVASAGFGAAPQAASPQTVGQNAGATIVDRSKKIAKLILKLPGTASNFVAQHRSHSSHRSHYSSSGGGGAAPVVRPPNPVTPPSTLVVPAPPPVRSAVGSAVATNTASGEVQSVDTAKRSFLFRQSELVFRTIGYRDDTKFETEAGASIRFDDFAAVANGQVPIAKGDKVELSWRMSADGKLPIAVTILKKAQ
jgi:hypothetical protein